MLPMTLVNILVTGLWRFMTPGAARWLFCALALAGAYLALGQLVAGGKQLARRNYHYAD